MTKQELDILHWLVQDHRSLENLLAMPDLGAWVKSHGGKCPHLDAALRISIGLRYRHDDAIFQTNAPNVVRLGRHGGK